MSMTWKTRGKCMAALPNQTMGIRSAAMMSFRIISTLPNSVTLNEVKGLDQGDSSLRSE